ncbi:ABC transporter substrate-binding protein [Micromonospora sp. KC721]|uniref:ABC transporter substrate-binding protein n=1 Tax=Micromonospora sp. KC721 TaxID=2530380 RepID=UPI001043B991|nr:ABC transporter substrate-binding protein [Micromonospora sp. KC721]TDB77107.1 ABC transporter substrate-binding protein [Micromonospora sp. KC721]
MSLFSRRLVRRLGFFTVLSTAAALTLTACSDDSPGTSDNAANSSISINGTASTIVENWNPFSPTQLQPTLGVIHEALYYYNLASDVPPRPMLATAYSWDAAGKQLTITTREGVKWSDGQPFTARDVAFTFELIRKNKAINGSGLALTSAKATDDKTVVLTFPTTSFTTEPGILGNTAIIPEHVWSKISDPAKTTNPNPVGTGPYKLKSLNAQGFVMEKNPNYWQPGKPQIQTVRYITLATADAASAALTAGQVDWMSSYIPNLDKIISGHKNLAYVNTPALTASIFTCSNAAMGCKGPQTDRAVRQAMYHALNRDQLNKLAGGGFAGTASPTLLLPDRDQKWIADPAHLRTPGGPDVAKANQILDAAGWVRGADGIRSKGGERLSMRIQTVTGWSDFISLNDAMAQQFKEVGIELKPTQLSSNEWNNNQVQGKFQLSLDSIGLGASSNPYFTYNGRYTSATTAKVGESAGTSGNYARYSNPTVDQAVAAAGATNDENVQKQHYATIQAQIVQDLPYIPIYLNSTLTQFNTSRATGWPTNDNKYAFPATWKSWDSGIVLTSLKPAG